MKNSVWFAALLLFPWAADAQAAAGQATVGQTTVAQTRRPDIIVDDDKVQCPTATFASIQDAINAANPGNLIRVCAGTYREQLSISKALSIVGDTGATLLPGAVVANATGSSGNAIAAAILAHNAAGVEISGLIVDTSNNGITSCATDLIGILFQNSSGTIAHNAVRNVRLSAALNGCQSGDAIVVQSLGGAASQVNIDDNSVHDYQKNGITGNESGTQVIITDNVVAGFGPTTALAQNGIQIGFGGTGSIVRNTVTGNIYSPCVSPTNCTANGTGILVFESDKVTVNNNNVASNQVGIFISGQHSTIDSNNISNSTILVGIDLAGDHNTASGNTVTNSGEAAIFLEGNDNTMVGNEFTEAPVGILSLAGTVGNIHYDSSYFAISVKNQDPSAQKMVHAGPRR